jgi:hypothetical protein
MPTDYYPDIIIFAIFAGPGPVMAKGAAFFQ